MEKKQTSEPSPLEPSPRVEEPQAYDPFLKCRCGHPWKQHPFDGKCYDGRGANWRDSRAPVCECLQFEPNPPVEELRPLTEKDTAGLPGSPDIPNSTFPPSTPSVVNELASRVVERVLSVYREDYIAKCVVTEPDSLLALVKRLEGELAKVPAEEPGELVKRIADLRRRCQNASDGDNSDYMADTLLECDRFLASLLEQRDTKSQKKSVAKFIDWVKTTPHQSLTGDGRIAYDAQVRVLDQLACYLEGRDDYLNAYVESPRSGGTSVDHDM